MNMSQLIEELSERTGYHPHDTDRVVRIFFDSIKNAISQKDKVEIRGFGSFNLKNYKGYTGRNPRSGEQVQVKSKKLTQYHFFYKILIFLLVVLNIFLDN